jgi:peptidyl-tRNA hydrolase
MKVNRMINLTQHTTQRLEENIKMGKTINVSSICDTALNEFMDRIENKPKDDSEAKAQEEAKYKAQLVINHAVEFLLVNPSKDRFEFKVKKDAAIGRAFVELVSLGVKTDIHTVENRIMADYFAIKEEKEGEKRE